MCMSRASLGRFHTEHVPVVHLKSGVPRPGGAPARLPRPVLQAAGVGAGTCASPRGVCGLSRSRLDVRPRAARPPQTRSVLRDDDRRPDGVSVNFCSVHVSSSGTSRCLAATPRSPPPRAETRRHGAPGGRVGRLFPGIGVGGQQVGPPCSGCPNASFAPSGRAARPRCGEGPRAPRVEATRLSAERPRGGRTFASVLPRRRNLLQKAHVVLRTQTPTRMERR